ncbi:MAG: D-aminoacyl-tRNA deacylase [Candidatus Micrarchaeia archaeon]
MLAVYSKNDIAGINIAKFLKEYVETFSVSDILHCEEELKGIKEDCIIFVSRHKSEKGLPCFTVHTPGNFGKAEFGGKDREICIASPNEMKTILINIDKHVEIGKLKKVGWEVCMECTHHGPYIEIPCFFVEIGSSENEWKNELAAKIVAEAIISSSFKPYKWPVAFGVGGTHYCPKFTKYELASAREGNPFAFSHVLPNYHVDEIDYETFKKGITMSREKVSKVLIDWKGLKSAQREKVISFIKKCGIEYEKV